MKILKEYIYKLEKKGKKNLLKVNFGKIGYLTTAPNNPEVGIQEENSSFEK